MASATIATSIKCLTPTITTTTTTPKPSKPSLIAIPKGLISSKPLPHLSLSSSGALAGAVFSALSFSEPAFAVQQIANLAEGGDNRGLALLLPIIPALGWVLYNILQPALNQINRMRNTSAVVAGLGIGGLVGLGFGSDAIAAEAEKAAEAVGSDNRGQLLLIVVAPAILWVLYNILQPALNQLNRMRSD